MCLTKIAYSILMLQLSFLILPLIVTLLCFSTLCKCSTNYNKLISASKKQNCLSLEGCHDPQKASWPYGKIITLKQMYF